MNALLLHNKPVAGTAWAPDSPNPWPESDLGILAEVRAVAEALALTGTPYTVAAVSDLEETASALRNTQHDTVFNLVERLNDSPAAFCNVPQLCSSAGLACTGNTSPCLHLTLDKWITKQHLLRNGIPTPAGILVPVDSVPTVDSRPPFPVIVKPTLSDGSEGIDGQSVVRGAWPALNQTVRRVHTLCHQPALIEQFIPGREFNVAIFETTQGPQCLPVAEIDFSLFPPTRERILDYEVKWQPGTIAGLVSPRKVPASIPDSEANRIRAVALAAWTACGCNDFVRVDMRMDPRGNLFVLDVNANPDISPHAGFSASLAAASIPYHQFVTQLLDNARQRARQPTATPIP